MSLRKSRARLAVVLLTASALSGGAAAWAQEAPGAPVQTAPQAVGPLDQEMRRKIFDTVWSRVNTSYYDPKFGGVDWNGVKAKYAPKVDAAASDAEFYSLLSQMLKELNQSHFAIIPPENMAASAPTKVETPTPGAPTTGDPAPAGPVVTPLQADDSEADPASPGSAGITIQLVQGLPMITRVVPGSGAEAAGLKTGFVIDSIGMQPVGNLLNALKKRGRNEREYAMYVRLGMESILSGPSGRRVPIGYRDAEDKLQTTLVKFNPVTGQRAQFGRLPAMNVEVENKRLDGNIGYIRFNIFLKPVLDAVPGIVKEFKDTKGIIIDVRGNPGGLGAIATAIARQFYSKPSSLGEQTMRSGNNKFLINPVPNPYLGPVAILTDEGSASTSEILAAGMKETKRAATVGTTTAGEALPSYIEILPGGARLQFAIADLKTPSGKMIEGNGVTPTVPVVTTRRDLLAGRDPALDAAVTYINEQAAKEKPASK